MKQLEQHFYTQVGMRCFPYKNIMHCTWSTQSFSSASQMRKEQVKRRFPRVGIYYILANQTNNTIVTNLSNTCRAGIAQIK